MPCVIGHIFLCAVRFLQHSNDLLRPVAEHIVNRVVWPGKATLVEAGTEGMVWAVVGVAVL